MWPVHLVAEAYGQRPSTLLSIGEPWLAYQVDLATLVVGREVESMTAPDEKGRPRMSVAEALRRLTPEAERKPAPVERGRFRSPQELVMRGIAVPERGEW